MARKKSGKAAETIKVERDARTTARQEHSDPLDLSTLTSDLPNPASDAASPASKPTVSHTFKNLQLRPKLTFVERKALLKKARRGPPLLGSGPSASKPSPSKPSPSKQPKVESESETELPKIESESETELPKSEVAKGKQPEMELPEDEAPPSGKARKEPKWVPLPENYRKYVIEERPFMKDYTMVFNQKPSTYALLLRFPNRRPDQPYSERTGQKPLEIRIKPQFGHVEVDIPIKIEESWDIKKAIEYQQAMRSSTVLQQGASYTLAGGLGATEPADKSKTRPKPTFPSMETLMANVDDANNKGHVMNKITLAGRIHPPQDHEPSYMFGTFDEENRKQHLLTFFSTYVTIQHEIFEPRADIAIN